jgi:hypothetical protein
LRYALSEGVLVGSDFAYFFSGAISPRGGGQKVCALALGTGGAGARIFAPVSENFFLGLTSAGAQHQLRDQYQLAAPLFPHSTTLSENCREIHLGGVGPTPAGGIDLR